MPEGFDLTAIFTAIVNGAKSVIGLATEFPLNLWLGASILGIGLGLYRGLKRS
ncbi:MAG: hypothetical protein J1E35_03590 [Lachnospiraceae bacterium]|nr:hypothetical protein [Lachnospiraceae bacterium]